jgi:putative phosphoribosyl transferase
MQKQFQNRAEAGRQLAAKLTEFKDRADVVILALPRGGVPVGFEVAKALNAPLDVFIVRKLGVPGQEELAFGAIASGGTTVFNEELVRALCLPTALLERVVEKEQKELERRETLYRHGKAAPDLSGKIVIIVDDGLATGATMRAAVTAIRTLKPLQIVVAVPVASSDTCRDLKTKTDALCVCVMTPEPFYGVGMWYRDFEQTTDEEVSRLLGQTMSLTSKAA